MSVESYQKSNPSLEAYWRSIILFGRNAASYKFALAKSLLELSSGEATNIRLEDLSIPFSRHICEHLEKSEVQGTSKTSKFLSGCKDYNQGKITEAQLIDLTYRYGFENVIDAFHIVNREETDVKFFEKNYGESKNIILRDELFLVSEEAKGALLDETESRWRLVETAWELGVNPNLLMVNFDKQDQELFILDQSLKRKDITSIRSSLNGYQKGICFYCNGDYEIEKNHEDICQVDHFYPHILKQALYREVNLDGVWNLVLACKDCNSKKSASIGHKKYLDKLYRRNEYLILSHNPLRETLMNQTGKSFKKRLNFYQEIDKRVEGLMPSKNRWQISSKDLEFF